MACHLIDDDASCSTLRAELTHTYTLLDADPETRPLAPAFAAMRAECIRVDGIWCELHDTLTGARALVRKCGERLTAFVDVFAGTLDILTSGDRAAPLFQLFVGPRGLKPLKRPRLPQRLAKIRRWVPELAASTYPKLAALAPDLAAIVAEADTAVEQVATVENQIKIFRLVGDRKALYDAANVLRRRTWGELGALAGRHPDRPSTATFADRFFLHTSRPGQKSSAEYDALLARNDLERTALVAARERALTREHEAEEAEAKEAERKREIAEAKEAVKAAEERLAALEQKPPRIRV